MLYVGVLREIHARARALGTPSYTSPELISENGAALTAHLNACDVYAYAVLSGKILTDKRAYRYRALSSELTSWGLFLKILKDFHPKILARLARCAITITINEVTSSECRIPDNALVRKYRTHGEFLLKPWPCRAP